MGIYSSHFSDDVADNPYFNRGEYVKSVTVVSKDTIYSAGVSVIAKSGNPVLAAWGLTRTQDEAQQLGETLEDLLRLRYEQMESRKATN